VVVLVGPSGSEKNAVARSMLEMTDCFEKLVSYTTEKSAAAGEDSWYHYVPVSKFRKMSDNGDFFESTTYAHHSYGSRKSDVEEILGKGKHVLTVMDICGAMALKTHFDNVITIYIKRDKRALLTSILRKNSSVDDKVNRLLSIEAEIKNAQVCDYVVDMNDCEDTARRICESLNAK
jgi:guanylate kinase